MKIWLDDTRTPLREYLWVKSVNEAKKLILSLEKEGVAIDLLDLDYDLGEYGLEGGSGMRLLEWLADRGRFYPVVVHSTHIYGRAIMEDYLAEKWPRSGAQAAPAGH